MTIPLVIRPDGRGVWIQTLTFGRARVVVGALDSPTYDDGW